MNKITNVIWNLCHVLRDDGIVYHKYLSELTYLLFLKNARAMGREDALPEGYRWINLLENRGSGMLSFYRKMLTALGEDATDTVIRKIYAFPTTVFSHDENLEKVVSGIEAIDWKSHQGDGLGDIYESLLERNATEARSGSGQYFTPRPLVECIIDVVQPGPGEIIQDPSVGTGGFLIAADRFFRSTSNGKKSPNYYGVEIEADTYRLCLMNLFLHHMPGEIIHGDALTSDSARLPVADLIIANPPFGSSVGGARARRQDLPFPTSNKQLMFLQHIYMSLKDDGRAAVVVPDNVLYDNGAALRVRRDLMDRCDLHTILKLPQGIFYAPGVKTNVLFFNRGKKTSHATKAVWVYDLRTGLPQFGKKRPLKNSDFDDFKKFYGNDKLGQAARDDGDSGSRFRRYTRSEIADNGDKLDLRWMEDRTAGMFSRLETTELLDAITEHLRSALAEIEDLTDRLSGQ